MKAVYLAGGFYTGWREQVKTGCDGLFEWVDPETDKPNSSLMDYTKWDLEAILNSQIVFGYLSSSHKYGGLALELGYAYATLVPIILVVQKPNPDGMLLAVSSAVFTEFQPAIEKLRRWA